MKSSYDLAMERLDKKNGKSVALTDKKKRALAEVDERVRAKIAEIEIMLKPRIAEARAAGDFELAMKVDVNLRNEIAKFRDDGEAEKKEIRGRA